ncbi:MAG: hypothetical protein IPK00_06055 [Deltaproteobacteria bacterium]|nr:hypothetical protein [Deltaproteobacteria bacterium]
MVRPGRPRPHSRARAPEDPAPGEPFCYAGKAHPELAPSGQLLVTYVCNFWAADPEEIAPVLERLRTSPTFYRPRVLLFRVPPASGQTWLRSISSRG